MRKYPAALEGDPEQAPEVLAVLASERARRVEREKAEREVVAAARGAERERMAREYPGFLPFLEAKRVFEREYVLALLEATGGNVSESARIAGKDRRDFYMLMRRCGVKVERGAEAGE